MPNALHTSALTSLPLLARGKVRDNYAVGSDRLLMVASDRLSAFDVILGEPIAGKGKILTQMALFWFDKLKDLCPNHLTGQAPEGVVTAAEVPQVEGRSMLVKRLKPIPVEAVVRTGVLEIVVSQVPISCEVLAHRGGSPVVFLAHVNLKRDLSAQEVQGRLAVGIKGHGTCQVGRADFPLCVLLG